MDRDFSTKADYIFLIDLDNTKASYFDIFPSLASGSANKKLSVILSYQQVLSKARLSNNFLSSLKGFDLSKIFLGNIVNDTEPFFDKSFFDGYKFILPNHNRSVYFSDIKGSVDFIIKNLFSFSNRSSACYISEPFGVLDIKNIINDEKNISTINEKLYTPNIYKKEVSGFQIDKLSRIIFATRPQQKIATAKSTSDISRKIKTKRKIAFQPNKTVGKIFKAFVFVLFLFVFLPAVLFWTSAWITKFNINRSGDQDYVARSARSMGGVVSKLSTTTFDVYNKVPFVERRMDSAHYSSLVFESINDTYLQEERIGNLTKALALSVVGSSVKDTGELTNSLRSSLDMKYKSIEFLKGDIKFVLQKFGHLDKELEEFLKSDTKKILDTKEFLTLVPNLLGSESQKEYFLIIQDEEKLTPSGGEILVSVYLSFDKGRLSNSVVYKNEEIDQNTKGKRDLPAAFKNLRMTPSFSNSNLSENPDDRLENILWYLDNSLNMKPDGVIFINKKTLGKLTNTLGIKSEPLGVEVQTQNLIDTLLRDINPKDQTVDEALRVIADSLRNKDAHVWFTDTQTRLQFAKLGFGVGAVKSSCEDCHQESISVLETRIEGEGLSTDLERKADLKISYQERVIKATLKFEYQPQTSKAQGIYFKLVLPQDSSFSPVKLTQGDSVSYVSPDIFSSQIHKTAGLYLDIADKSIIEINWEQPYEPNKFKSYLLTWEKQPGVVSYPVKIAVDPLSKLDLTKDVFDSYNTDSSFDIEIGSVRQ